MRVLRWAAVRERIQLSRTTIWRLERQGKFPRRFKIGSKSVGWLENEVEDWVKAAHQSTQ
ncbi:MAG: AlpA family phage regulatory protein [Planctomycetota bacterium]|nr:AlpA family phage regulatory protein [Planctomycetota bacterium]